jgi:hypothetical protein
MGKKRAYSAKPSITSGDRCRGSLPGLALLLGMGAASHRPHSRSVRPKATQAIGPNPVPTLLTSRVRVRWPTVLHRRPPFIRCRGGCGKLSSRLCAYILPQLPLCRHRIAIRPSTTSIPPRPLWPPSLSPSVLLLFLPQCHRLV